MRLKTDVQASQEEIYYWLYGNTKGIDLYVSILKEKVAISEENVQLGRRNEMQVHYSITVHDYLGQS